ncbi:hypothetical protein ACTPU4_006028, partial [Klebsiella variicola]
WFGFNPQTNLKSTPAKARFSEPLRAAFLDNYPLKPHRRCKTPSLRIRKHWVHYSISIFTKNTNVS